LSIPLRVLKADLNLMGLISISLRTGLLLSERGSFFLALTYIGVHGAWVPL